MKRILYILFVLFLSVQFYAQDSTDVKKWTTDGYFSYMGSYLQSDIMGMEYMDNLAHNRLNFHWYPSSKFTAVLEMRNRFMIGDQMRADSFNIAKEALEDDALSANIVHGKMFVLNSMIDRLYLKYTFDKWDFTLGRQRINWGQTFAFNANDIFNAYSFVDFDYQERPGGDAFRMQYYPSYTSTVEAAVKYTNDSTITAAALGRLSKWGYDWQVIAGMYNSSDWVLGGGWSGNLKAVAFSGEFSYLHPKKKSSNSSGLFFASLNANYTFSNSFSIQLEGFYNQYMAKHSGNFFSLMGGTQDIKNLSLSEFTVFANAMYPITPIINTSLACMYYPDIKGTLLFPTVDISLSDNSTLSAIAMYYSGDFGLQTGDVFLGFIRYKTSF